MALVDITPVMTSNTTPKPFVAKASTEYSASLGAWCAFDGKESTAWRATSDKGYITLDFSNKTRVSAFSLFCKDNYAPKDFDLEGSNDGTVYEKITSITGQTGWNLENTRTFNLSDSVNYRYYKINIFSNNGLSSDIMTIYEIKFYAEEDKPNPASLRYTLPFGSKTRLDELHSDLTYMLATEDDGDNEGTLRIVDKNGKFIRAKAEMVNADVLFDGIASTNGTIYNMTGKISDYKYLLVIGGVTNGTTNVDTIMIPTNRIKSYSSTVEQFSIGIFSSSAYYYRVAISFVSESSFTRANSSLSGWTSPVITNIYGIK